MALIISYLHRDEYGFNIHTADPHRTWYVGNCEINVGGRRPLKYAIRHNLFLIAHHPIVRKTAQNPEAFRPLFVINDEHDRYESWV